MSERSPREQLEELKWLRGGVLAVHAVLNAVDQFDDDARARFDWSALAYLTEQMQQVVIDGALASQLDELEEAPSKTVTELMSELRASLDRASGASPEKPRRFRPRTVVAGRADVQPAAVAAKEQGVDDGSHTA